MNLKEKLAALLKRGNELVAKSKTDAFTDADATELEAVVAEAKEVKARIERQEKGAALVQAVGGIDGIHGSSDGKGHLSFDGLKDGIVDGMRGVSQRTSPGVKALVPAGETIVSIPVVNTQPIAGGVSHERAPRLLDLIPANRRAAVYKVLKQVVVADSGAASVVAPGAVKPTKKLGLTTVEDRLRVVAVLSEPIDKFTLEDASNLRTWVGAELADAIMDAIELEILTGDGTGEHFTGLANTSGIQTQAFSTDRITTIAAGLAKLTNLSIQPSFIALSAADALALQTTRNASGAFDLGGAIDTAASTAWGTRFAVVAGLAAGDGYVVGTETVELAHDGGGVRVEWGTPGDTWTKNQVQARVEGRFNLDVLRPHGVVRLALTGA